MHVLEAHAYGGMELRLSGVRCPVARGQLDFMCEECVPVCWPNARGAMRANIGLISSCAWGGLRGPPWPLRQSTTGSFQSAKIGFLL